jgi:translation initiation factor 1
LEDQTLKDVVAKLKKTLGCGGSYKEGFIEVQGEHVDKIYQCLENLGYKFKHKK